VNTEPIIAVNTLAYHGHDLRTALREISELGATYVEPALISSYYEEFTEEYFTPENANELCRFMTENGLKMVALGAHMDLGQAGSTDAFKRRMEFAKALGAKFVHTNAARVSEEPFFLKNIEALIPVAEDLDLIITLENPGDGTENIVSTGKAGAALIVRIGSQRVRLNYDFSNVFSYSKGRVKPEDDFRYALPFSAHFHLKEIKPAGAEWAFVEIGKGVTDYGGILKALAQEEPIPPMSIELPLRFKRNTECAERIPGLYQSGTESRLKRTAGMCGVFCAWLASTRRGLRSSFPVGI
jgi:sugar phosphate isomerase/epimerase